MKLEEISNVVAGQIMTRVTAEDEVGEAVSVLVPKAIVNGIIVKEHLGKAILNKSIDLEKYTRAGDVVIKLSTPYDAAFVSEDCAGLAIPSFCAVIRIKEECEVDSKYVSAFLNTSYVRENLTSKVKGSPRPMIKISDVRALDIPDISFQDMQNIGEAYRLSGIKKNILSEMIEEENKIMENIVLKSVKERIENVQ